MSLINLLQIQQMRATAQQAEVFGLKWQARFILSASRYPAAYQALCAPSPDSALARLASERPRIANFLVAPYLDARWDVEERVRRLSAHAEAMTGALAKYGFSIADELHLLDLTGFGMEGYSLVLDKPQWFLREGLLTINLFQADLRLFSVSFAFDRRGGGLDLLIGSVQGRKIDGILDVYRDFTKMSHGVRPRDFMIEALRMLARAEGVTRILAIPDQFRHQRHPYFSRETGRELPLNYDEIWLDRGGILGGHGYFELPLSVQREFDTIPARKRSLYRKRFDLLERLETALVEQLAQVEPRRVQSHDSGQD